MAKVCQSWLLLQTKTAGTGAGIGLISYTVFSTVVEFLSFYGASMEPTIYESDIGIGEKITSYDKLRR